MGIIRSGRISIGEAGKAYEENLKITLERAEQLINELKGRIVITSDHGNCFGEWGLNGHLRGVHVKPLAEIPWLEIDSQLKPAAA